MDDYLAKPVRREDLAAALARVSGHADEEVPEVGVEDVPANGVVDPTVLQSLISRLGARGPLMLEKLVGTWSAETDKRLAELQAAVGADDADAVARVAHAIRGGSASLGATLLAQVCGEVERRVRAGEQVDLPAAQAQVAEAVAQTRPALAQLRVGSGG